MTKATILSTGFLVSCFCILASTWYNQSAFHRHTSKNCLVISARTAGITRSITTNTSTETTHQSDGRKTYVTVSEAINTSTETTDQSDGKKNYVTVSEEWLCNAVRLGNKMCMLSTAIAAAAATNRTFVMPKSKRSCNWIVQLKEFFHMLNSSKDVPVAQTKRWHQAYEKGPFLYSKIPDNTNISITGFRQTWKYFEKKVQQEAIRRVFTFSSRYENFAQTNLAKASRSFPNIKNPILIGLHMRIGDLLVAKSGKRLATKAYYDTALQKAFLHFNKSTDIVFVAASDSPNLAKKMLADASEKYHIFWSGGTAFEDMATLSKCNHSIISGGTFGFWTAWLAGGTTFYNGNVSLPGTPFSKRYREQNFNLPDWIRVAWLR